MKIRIPKIWFALLAALLTAQVGRAAPVQIANKLVFTRGQGSTDAEPPGDERVWTMNSDGTAQKEVWRVPKGYGQFGGFDSQGKRALSFNGFNLYLYDLKTGARRRIYLHSSGWATYIAATAFSADGKSVIWAAGSGNGGTLSSRVYVLNLDGSARNATSVEKSRVVLPKSDNLFEPRLSPDGQRIVASVGERFNTYPEMFSEAHDIWTVNRDGSAPFQVTSNPQPLEQLNTFDQDPGFGPSGKTLAFVRRQFWVPKGESNDLWLIGSDGKNPRRLTNYAAAAQNADKTEFAHDAYNRISHPCFSADGTQIAFNQTGHDAGIYRVDADGRNLQRLSGGTLVQWAS